jgi:FkbM family methyltransferase
MTTIHDALALVLNALERGDITEARSVGEQIRRAAPDHPDALHLLAVIAERQGDPNLAMSFRRQAIADSAGQRAALLRGIGAIADARVMYEEALKIDTYNALACNALGEMNRALAPFDPDGHRFAKPPLNLFVTPIGTYFLPSDAPDDIIIRRMKAGQVFEREVIESLRPYVADSSAVVDVGANLGQMTLLFSEMVGAAGHVYSLEADEYVFHVLTKNIAANAKTNVTPVWAAVYDTCGKMVFYPVQDFQRFGSYGSYGIDPNATDGRGIATITIDSLKIEHPISLIKVDIQGSDLFALRGARETIQQHQPTIIFEFEQQFQAEFGTSLDDYMEFVKSINYKVEKMINGINYLIVPQ